MSSALSTGVTGLLVHQKMLDIAGNNLANINTTAFKASRITFSELLSETMKKASQPTANIGGTNPQQIGSGVGIAGITPLMSQGNIVSTGNPLDMAIEGEGYFVLSDGSKDFYTRAGAFAVDSNTNLVDPATGYLIQRYGSVGEADGFQTDTNIKVPYGVALPASATSSMMVQGNLSADAILSTAQTQVLTSDIAYSTSGATVVGNTGLDELDQFSGAFADGETGTITVSGYNHDGTALTDGAGSLDIEVDADTDLDSLVDSINDILSDDANKNDDGTYATASLSNGRIIITDGVSGYSKLDMNLAYTASTGGTDSLTMPGYFKYSTVGGEEVQNVSITIYDSQGGARILSGAFVRTDTKDTWDMLLTSVSGDVSALSYDNRRIEGIEFDPSSGSYSGLNATTADTAEFVVSFAHDPSNPQTISVDLGTADGFDGLTQFATGETGASTAVIREQNGYAEGSLASVSVNNAGMLVGSFSNGIKKSIATLQIALFQNTAGLESIGGGYFSSSANSGEAVATQGLAGGAGAIHGGSLEKSNSDVATEFVNMIQAQNGYQANARTIKVANDILRELTGLIR